MTDQIFGILPTRIFKPLASRNRKTYIAVLQGLYDEFYGDIMILETPRQTDILAFIRRFQTDLLPEDDDDTAQERQDTPDELKSDDDKDPAYNIFKKLVDTGWLKVHRDGYL